jgi:putative PEP-CTERM system histidine kinase
VTLVSQMPFVAGGFSLVLAGVSLYRKKPSIATWCFFSGMIALGIDSVLIGVALRATEPTQVLGWMTASMVVKCFIPAIWLSFSLTYSRSGYRERLRRWGIVLALVSVLPAALAFVFRDQLLTLIPPTAAENIWRLQFGPMANLLNAILVVTLALILMNLEQTFRSAVGTMRWRIKYVVLAMVVMFGARLYVGSQGIVFSAPNLALWSVESGALLVGCVFLTVAYARTGWAEIDVHPSAAILRSSVTVLLVGGYLFIVGVLALVVRGSGSAELFQLQAFVLLVGMAGLAVMLLSDRARQAIDHFVVRHFRKSQHDSVRIWTLFSQGLATSSEQDRLCSVSARLISETFGALSVTLWVLDDETGRLVIGDSTNRAAEAAGVERSANILSSSVASGMQGESSPFDLERRAGTWADELRRLNPTTFPNGGHRWCVPMLSGSRTVGLIVLADRINGAAYTVEERELLRCIGAQISSVLINIRLADEVAHARELEAFRTMSAFFVHDLKNAAASLNLMLKNLPVHFDDPAFRQDALRGIGNTARRIDDMIARLSAIRDRPDSVRVDTDLNQVVTATLANVNNVRENVEVLSELHPVPTILADREQLQSVVTNLVLNAHDALVSGGRIRVRTEHRGGRVVLSVVDNGCGMSPAFVRDSLFRPFRSTKKKGLGIGLFQLRAIVLAHGGGVHVESEVGKGTSFQASFPSHPGRS